MKKPEKTDFGYQGASGFDDESGWMFEGGEEKYYEALDKWEKEQRDQHKPFYPYSVGDRVVKYPSALDRAAQRKGEEKIISGFAICGGVSCCRFEGSTTPCDIELISPV